MSLINCPECGKNISERAEKCPDCGYPMNVTGRERILYPLLKKKYTKPILAVAILLCLILFFLTIYYRQDSVIKSRDEAYVEYLCELERINDEICSYDNAVSEYNAKAEIIIEKNNDLDASIERAQELVCSGSISDSCEKTINLVNAIKDAKKNRVESPEPIEKVRTITIDRKLRNLSKRDIMNAINDISMCEFESAAAEYDVRQRINHLRIPDYSVYLDRIAQFSKELEESNTY